MVGWFALIAQRVGCSRHCERNHQLESPAELFTRERDMGHHARLAVPDRGRLLVVIRSNSAAWQYVADRFQDDRAKLRRGAVIQSKSALPGHARALSEALEFAPPQCS